MYKTLELEIDGIFRLMFLLEKNKYAVLTFTEKRIKHWYIARKTKLDLIKKDWCIQSKDTFHYVLDQILSQDYH